MERKYVKIKIVGVENKLMKRFEYCYIKSVCGDKLEFAFVRYPQDKIDDIGDKKLIDVLNDLGSDGWEIACTAPYLNGDDHLIYFKREIIN